MPPCSQLRDYLATLLLFLLIPLLALTLFLSQYSLSCGWSLRPPTSLESGALAGARIVFLADPQIEGDDRANSDPLGNIANDINDYYQKHIVDSMCRLSPDMVVVLGDLLSYQKVSEEEHLRRAKRYRWITDCVHELGIPLINVTGNHDIGYGGEISDLEITRFESAFGPSNVNFSFRGHLFVNVNSQLLDESKDHRLRNQTWSSLNEAAAYDNSIPKILLTHIPLHKRMGICADDPTIRRRNDRTVLWQNFLSPNATAFILDSVAPEFVFSGHDHQGCHHVHQERGNRGGTGAGGSRKVKGAGSTWKRLFRSGNTENDLVGEGVRGGGAGQSGPRAPEVRRNVPEFTVRSMMGGFGGYAGLFEFAPAPSYGGPSSMSSPPLSYTYHFGSCSFVPMVIITILWVTCLSWLVLACAWAVLFPLLCRVLA